MKSGPHCVIKPNDEISLPVISNSVDWEAELAVIIGKSGRNISVDRAFEHVAGYTIMNDLSARDHSKRDDWPRWGVDWFGHKNFDGAAPLGPWVTPADKLEDPYKCQIKLWVNDEEMQNEFVSDLIFDITEQIEWITKRLTLLPGDVISTGTPSGVGRPRGIFLKPGDTVRINIDGIAELINSVVHRGSDYRKAWWSAQIRPTTSPEREKIGGSSKLRRRPLAFSVKTPSFIKKRIMTASAPRLPPSSILMATPKPIFVSVAQ